MTDEFLVSKNFDEIKNSSNNIILFGSVGAGKTTLINKLCNVDLLTKEDGFSCTRDVQYSRTPDGNIIKCNIGPLTDSSGNDVETANRAQMIVRAKLPQYVPADSFIRKMRTDPTIKST